MTTESQSAQPEQPAPAVQLRALRPVSRREFLATSSAVALAALGAETLLTSCQPPPPYQILLMMAVQSIQDSRGSIPPDFWQTHHCSRLPGHGPGPKRRRQHFGAALDLPWPEHHRSTKRARVPPECPDLLTRCGSGEFRPGRAFARLRDPP
jgi:hypothetical protein